MQEFIKQVFANVEIIGPHEHQGHYGIRGPVDEGPYDLVTSDAVIILPMV